MPSKTKPVEIDDFDKALKYTFDMTRILFKKLYVGYKSGGIVLNGPECYQALIHFLYLYDSDGHTEEGNEIRKSLKDIEKILPISISKVTGP